MKDGVWELLHCSLICKMGEDVPERFSPTQLSLTLLTLAMSVISSIVVYDTKMQRQRKFISLIYDEQPAICQTLLSHCEMFCTIRDGFHVICSEHI